jgi:hypothetical protein
MGWFGPQCNKRKNLPERKLFILFLFYLFYYLEKLSHAVRSTIDPADGRRAVGKKKKTNQHPNIFGSHPNKEKEKNS